MALALYRRYRPDTFEGVIGQDQVTVPLMRALDEGKLTHAYLFSGPRGCGKTSSARILARCVNCAKGPTSHPCGECESCKDLATGGPGSIDVVEIDAASHNGVDDARELRERAGFAPARDRYKIFILDEAHMVTQQGFNALLKIVEEPPEHVMFIFATTEPDKVIGTIRSRTHHYPFRLVPQEVMGPYLETICDKEGIKPEPGVLKLAMRAGGGSMRDTLSVLDQLMVGSVEGVITHDAAVALLGFTPEALIGEAVDAVIDHNGEALYGVIQKVVVGGFDPRRFVEDLLARVRDLLVLTLAGDRAESVLSDTAEAEDMDDLHRQAKALGLGALTAMADIINTTLGAMTGAISPRMRLELLAARLLAGSESGFATAAPAPASSGMPPAAASSTSTTSAASGTGASGFAGASRGGFAGASHGGFSGAARNQQAAAPQSTASHESVGGNGPVSDRPADSPSVQPVVATAAANAGWGAPAASPAVPAQPVTSPAASDNRSIDEKWDAAVAALPETIREYVSRDKVPTVKFGPNRKGLPCLSMTFDKSLSQHAFALAVDNSGKKAAAVVMDAVRNEFGANAVIAPSAVAANGERVESVKRMSPEQLAKVKQQIAMAKAGLAASSLGAGLGIHMGSEPKAPKPTATGQAEDADDSHRAGQSSASTAAKNWSDDDPWAKPAVSNASPQSADGFAPNEPAATPAPEEHHKKHVVQQLSFRRDAAAGREGHARHLCRQLAVQRQIRALHGTITGNVGVDDGRASRICQPPAEVHALFGADLLPPMDGNKSIFGIHPHGDPFAVALQHSGREIKIRHGHAAQDAATHTQRKVFFNALLRADAAAHLNVQAPLLCQRGNGSVVGKGAVLCAVQIHNVEIPGPGLHKLPGLCAGVLPVNGHTVIISLRQADNFAAPQVNGWE